MPKEVWVAIIVLGIFGFIAYAISKSNSSNESNQGIHSTSSVAAPRAVFAPNRQAFSMEEIDLAVTSGSCWIPIGQPVTVAGFSIPGGMLYVGEGLGDVLRSNVEPALINPKLSVSRPSGPAPRMDYWPSYSNISPSARGGYLKWLAEGRKDPSVEVGYVFLFFYGLERRVLSDSKQYSEVNQELPAILAEVRRLLSIYGGNGSFYSYASRFLDLVVTVGARDRVYRLPAPPQGQYKALTLRHKVALGQAAVDGAPLPVEWAFAWVMNDERMSLRTPAQRCKNEFQTLFAAQYAEQFDEGLKLPVNKTKLKALYKPASGSFGYGHAELTGADLPDVTILDGPFNKLKAIAEAATAQLEPFSRFIGKNPDKRDSMDAMVLLPPQLWPAENIHALTSWLVQLGVEQSPKTTTFVELVKHLPTWQGMTKDRVAAFAVALEQLDVGIEPDVRWGGAIPENDSAILLFPIESSDRNAKPSELYHTATLTLHLAAAVSAADGEVSVVEEEHLERQLERWLHLSAAEQNRLRTHLMYLLAAPPSLNALKKRVSILNENQKRSIAAFLIEVAQGDALVSPEEVKVLAKVYRLFGLDEKELFSHVHAAATEPVTVKPAAIAGPGFGVPPKAAAKPGAGIVLDHERIAALKADTERVAAMLGTIFTEAEQVAESAPEPEKLADELNIAGLDLGHAELVRVLTSRDTWTRAELEDLAADRGIMLDGALERINEAFLDAHGEPLLDGEDPVEINKNISKELAAA
jgi:uncharacterized tellurite resistance protein B-like protein